MFRRRQAAGPDDWFRSADWSSAAQAHLEEKLARARQPAQYLRIKGLALLEAGDARRGRAGVALLQRLIETFPEDAVEVAGAHALLASWHERQGQVDEAVAAHRATLTAEVGTNVGHGAQLALAALIARWARHEEFDEAERLLDGVAEDPTALVFRSQQYAYAGARSRLAAAWGRCDEAAAFAHGALWLAEANEPTAPRHPDVGLIDERAARAERQAFKIVAAGGDPEAASPLVEQFRGDDGEVRWEWGLTSRLHERPDGTAAEATRGGGTGSIGRRQSPGEPTAAVLAELRAAGIEVFDLAHWTLKALRTIAEVRIATPILLRALDGPDDADSLHWNVLSALADRRARAQATVPMIDLFRELAPARSPLTVAVGNRIASFARDEHLRLLRPMITDARFEHGHAYLWWAVGHMTSEAAVDLALEYVGDDAMWHGALHALCDIRSERAEPTLTALASREPIPLTRRQTGYWLRGEEPDAFVRDAERHNTQIEIATRGLEKLEKARAAGKSRHAP